MYEKLLKYVEACKAFGMFFEFLIWLGERGKKSSNISYIYFLQELTKKKTTVKMLRNFKSAIKKLQRIRNLRN